MASLPCSFISPAERRPIVRFVAASCVCLTALAVCAFAARPSRAEERYRDFARKLQEQGFADLAIEYLRSLERRDDVPDEIKEVLDYDIAKTLLAQSEDSDAETERRLLDESSKLLRKFLDEHKESDEAKDALADLASVLLKQGQKTLARADAEKDAAKREPLRAESRKSFEQAQENLKNAVAKYREALKSGAAAPASEPADKPEGETKTKPDPKTKSKTQPKTTAKKTTAKPRPKPAQKNDGDKDPEIENSLIIARLNLGIVEFFIGRSFDPTVAAEKPRQKTQLDKAAQTFDDLFQEYRGSFVGHVAHLWHGRTIEEQGDPRQALMIYDEILPNEPPKGAQVPKQQIAFFSQAEVFRLSALNKQKKYSEVIPEAEQWLREHNDRRRQAHGLGVQLELVKANIAIGLEKSAGSGERRGAFARAMQILSNEVAKFPSPYQDEAFKLRQQYATEVAAVGGKIASFDEGQFVGDAALGKEAWADAITAYEQALVLASEKTDEDERDATTYRLGFAYLRSGNSPKSAAICENLARSKPASRWAPDAAGIALVAHSAAYSAAPSNTEKQAAIVKIASIAKYMEDRWPQHSQADSARRTMGGILLYRREFAAAAEAFERINPGSPLHADAQLKAGQAYWSAYLSELGKPESERDAAAMGRWIELAKGTLEKSVAVQKAANPPIDSTPAGLVEAQLLSAEIELKTGSPANATPLLTPLVPLLNAERKDLAPFATRILIGAMEAAIAQNDLAAADALMADLEKQGGTDTTRITQVLVGLGRGLEQQLRQHEAAGRKTEAESVRKSYETFLERLGSREQQTFASLQYLAESYFALGNYEKAAETFERVIQAARSDPVFAQAKGSQGELHRVRLRRATALRLTKNFQPALTEIDTLLKVNERLLAAIMEKGRVLQDWGAASPPKFAEAAKHWDQVSRKLQTASPRPVEYFEARHGLAFCLAKSAKKDDAIKVLRSTMSLSPTVGGGDLRAKYESLLKELDPTGSTAPAKTATGPVATPAKNP